MIIWDKLFYTSTSATRIILAISVIMFILLLLEIPKTIAISTTNTTNATAVELITTNFLRKTLTRNLNENRSVIVPKYDFLLKDNNYQSSDFDVNKWYSGNPSQNCNNLCAGMSLQCDPYQIMQLNTYQRLQQVVAHFGSYCLKGEGFWSGSPFYEYYGGRGCWYFGDPSYTYQDALNGCGEASSSWNKKACACSAASTIPSVIQAPTIAPTIIPATNLQTTEFYYNGKDQYFTSYSSQLYVYMWGAGGQGYGSNMNGGSGAYVEGLLVNVPINAILKIIVGGSSGYGGGGRGGCCSGGGRSAIQFNGEDLVTAGGGGGGGFQPDDVYVCGGSATSYSNSVIQEVSYQGGLGVAPWYSSFNYYGTSPSSTCTGAFGEYSGAGGGGGTTTSGGDGCHSGDGLSSGSGTKYQGGNGHDQCAARTGGGGGGYYGGGGGVSYCDSGGGGGGSSYLRNLETYDKSESGPQGIGGCAGTHSLYYNGKSCGGANQNGRIVIVGNGALAVNPTLHPTAVATKSTASSSYCQSNQNGVVAVMDPSGNPVNIRCVNGLVLLAKINGGLNTWNYDSYLWTTDSTLNPTSLAYDQNEAKLDPYNWMSIDSIRLVMTDFNAIEHSNYLDLPLNQEYSSLLDLINSGGITTNAGRRAWSTLAPLDPGEPYCNMEGFSMNTNINVIGKLRIGLLENEQNECNSPDAAIGFGISVYAGATSAGSVTYYNPRYTVYRKFGYILGTFNQAVTSNSNNLLYTSGNSVFKLNSYGDNVVDLSTVLQCVQGSNPRSISFMMQTVDSRNGLQMILSSGSDVNQYSGFGIGISYPKSSSANSVLQIGSTTAAFSSSTGKVINDGLWHTFLVNFDGTTLSIDVDGSLINTATNWSSGSRNSIASTLNTFGNNNYLGQWIDGTYRWTGQLKNIQFTNNIMFNTYKPNTQTPTHTPINNPSNPNNPSGASSSNSGSGLNMPMIIYIVAGVGFLVILLLGYIWCRNDYKLYRCFGESTVVIDNIAPVFANIYTDDIRLPEAASTLAEPEIVIVDARIIQLSDDHKPSRINIANLPGSRRVQVQELGTRQVMRRSYAHTSNTNETLEYFEPSAPFDTYL